MVAMEVEELDQAGYGSDDGENSESGGGGYSGAWSRTGVVLVLYFFGF